MKRTITLIMAICGMIAGVSTLADEFTPMPGNIYDSNGNLKERFGSNILTNLRLEIKDDTDKVHLINTNNDPSIITKTYVLKHADPYELRPYLRKAVTTERITGGNKQTGGVPKVECIKYNDGTGILIISAEDYRFKPQKFGMGIDQIVEMLDQPKITSSSGTKTYVYFPKYWDSMSLSAIIKKNGMNVANDPDELTGGKDKVYADTGLNALLFYTPQYNKDNIIDMLKLYDTPTFEVFVKYTVYELNTENDDKVGVDFQSWKNGPGADIFSAAGRFGRNWAGDMAEGVINGRGWNSTKFVKFSPRWNTRYLDFLTAKGKAKVITEGKMNIMNEKVGVIEAKTEIPRFADGADISDYAVEADYMVLENATFWTDGTGANAGTRGDYRLTATDTRGWPITTDNFTGTVSLTKLQVDGVTTYEIRINSVDGAILHSGTKVDANHIKCYNLNIDQCTRSRQVVGVDQALGTPVYADSYSWSDAANWQTDRRMTIYRDKAIDTTSTTYGFELNIAPSVCEEATTLDIHMKNTSLIGFSSAGGARTSDSEVKTRVMCANNGQRFVIGGVEKKSIIRSVSKVPWLGSIPIVGWVLGNESEGSKKTQLVAVLECLPALPDTRVPEGVITDQKYVDKITKEAGVTNGFKENNLGFDQFIFDKEKINFDPLP